MAFEAFFLPAATGQRFCILHRAEPNSPVRGAVVFVHSFAEEMNKARRMAALQARTMAQAGYWVLQVDLHGCGDSSGDFGDASWTDWIEDVVLARDWLREQTDAEFWLWGLRSGCLVAAEAAKRIDDARRLLFWNPVLSGKQYLQQFLRLKIAGEMLAGDGKGVVERLKADLAQGKPVEIAGYTLSPDLVRGLENVELSLPGRTTRVEWLELSGKPDGGLSLAAAQRLEKWKMQGHDVRGTAVCGPSFWQTTEIAECGELLDATIAAMSADAQP